MLILRAVAVLSLSATLGGCVTPPHPATPSPQAAVAAPVSAPVTADGMYRGTSTRFLAQRRDCPHPGLITLYVQDRQFEYRWNQQLYVTAAIDPDGTVRGQGADVTLAGHREGHTIDGDITSGGCGLHFTARKEF